MKKYLSYSEMWLWYNKREEYVDQYVKGKEFEANDAMRLGTIIHKTIEEPRYPWMKELKDMEYKGSIIKIRKALNKLENKRAPLCEVPVRATTKDNIKLFGIFDGFDKTNRILYEYKTSINPFMWSQKKVDYNDQLSFYAYMYHLTYHSYFKEVRLYFINPAKATVQTFKTARDIRSIKYIAQKIDDCVYQMKQAGVWEKRLSREERSKKPML